MPSVQNVAFPRPNRKPETPDKLHPTNGAAVLEGEPDDDFLPVAPLLMAHFEQKSNRPTKLEIHDSSSVNIDPTDSLPDMTAGPFTTPALILLTHSTPSIQLELHGVVGGQQGQPNHELTIANSHHRSILNDAGGIHEGKPKVPDKLLPTHGIVHELIPMPERTNNDEESGLLPVMILSWIAIYIFIFYEDVAFDMLFEFRVMIQTPLIFMFLFAYSLIYVDKIYFVHFITGACSDYALKLNPSTLRLENILTLALKYQSYLAPVSGLSHLVTS